ncbi:unnamed protein product [marine sediment metagenome]|uniref:Uncharacterized protein n=1 Tax=marine sediment metagenome TaxID=412755 RepID=X0VX24_9ZZZZ
MIVTEDGEYAMLRARIIGVEGRLRALRARWGVAGGGLVGEELVAIGRELDGINRDIDVYAREGGNEAA